MGIVHSRKNLNCPTPQALVEDRAQLMCSLILSIQLFQIGHHLTSHRAKNTLPASLYSIAATSVVSIIYHLNQCFVLQKGKSVEMFKKLTNFSPCLSLAQTSCRCPVHFHVALSKLYCSINISIQKVPQLALLEKKVKQELVSNDNNDSSHHHSC